MYINDWDWTDAVIEHIARHRVGPEDVIVVWTTEPKYRRNRKTRAATHQMVGPDSSGRFLAVFILEDETYEGLWRVVTARGATDAERAWWERS